MTRLSDTQAILLSTAARRCDGNVLPLPGALRGGAAAKVVGALLSRGLVREQAVDSGHRADTASNAFWRGLEDGGGVLLVITPAGLEAIGVEHAAEPGGGAGPVKAATKRQARPKQAAATGADTAAPGSGDSKQALLIAMLRRKQGTTIAQIAEALGWQPHTVRGAFAGALKQRLGLAGGLREGRGRAGLPASGLSSAAQEVTRAAIRRAGRWRAPGRPWRLKQRRLRISTPDANLLPRRRSMAAGAPTSRRHLGAQATLPDDGLIDHAGPVAI